VAPPPLQLDRVVKRFRQGSTVVEALAGIDLIVQRGEFIAVMGASGSGKSTLLHTMAGLTDVDSGTVRVDGHVLAGLSDARLTRFRREKIGLVFQAFNLIPTLSAEDNIRLPAINRDALDKCVEALMQRLGIAARRMHKPDALSGGEQQRVAIARALITNPAIVLADEPTGSLDSTTGQSICRLLRELCDEQKRTIIIVTHEQAVASWASKIVVLKDGRKISEFESAANGDADLLASRYYDALRGAGQETLAGATP
jgi:putative ABC transport system ATP-binding protein